jgi:short-subunit dehydrogenase
MVILITGASSGIGRATAQACVRAGHQVALAARRLDRLEQLAAEIGRPDDVLLVRADMRRLEDIQRMVRETEARFGRVDALLANAGVGHGEPYAETTDEHILDQIEVNLLGVMRCAREVLPAMLVRGSGHILTVASVASEVPSPQGVAYAASKGGALAFSEGLRRELRGTGIHVTVIQPGFVRTEMTASVPLPMPGAEIIGNAVVKLLRSPRRRAVIPRYYGGVIWLNRLAPWLIDWALAVMQHSPRWQWEREK